MYECSSTTTYLYTLREVINHNPTCYYTQLANSIFEQSHSIDVPVIFPRCLQKKTNLWRTSGGPLGIYHRCI